jgi:plasmid stability protein
MSDKPVKDYDKFVVRLPEGMREAIAERAKNNGRSMNAEIIQVIEDALKDKNLNNSVATLSMALDTFKSVESAMGKSIEAKDAQIKAITNAMHVQADYINVLKGILKNNFDFDVDLIENAPITTKLHDNKPT